MWALATVVLFASCTLISEKTSVIVHIEWKRSEGKLKLQKQKTLFSFLHHFMCPVFVLFSCPPHTAHPQTTCAYMGMYLAAQHIWCFIKPVLKYETFYFSKSSESNKINKSYSKNNVFTVPAGHHHIVFFNIYATIHQSLLICPEVWKLGERENP